MPRILCLLPMRHFLTLAALLAATSAQACLFARDAQPKDWLDWASVLLAADVSRIDQDKAMDVVRLDVREAFKGPPAAQTATLQIPQRMWASCRLDRPTLGAHVLVAINANGDALLVPLTPDYAQRLRNLTPQSAPAPTSK
jgi:hypothetical protein